VSRGGSVSGKTVWDLAKRDTTDRVGRQLWGPAFASCSPLSSEHFHSQRKQRCRYW
jgi:hypothetical protein